MPSRLTDNFPTEILKVVLSFLTATDFATSTTTETSAGSNPKNTPSDDNKSLHNMDKSSSVTEEPAIPISIKTTTKGIWTIYQHVPTWTDSLPGIAIVRDLQGFYSDLPFVKLLLKDLWSMGPALVTVYVVSQVMSSIIPTLRLAQSAAFFHMVEKTVSTKQIDRTEVVWAIIYQVVYSTIDWLNYECLDWSTPILHQRYKYHFTQRIMRIGMRLDLPTSENPDVIAKFGATSNGNTGGKAWEAFETIVAMLSLFLELLSTSSYILGTIIYQPGGKTIALLCLLGPMVAAFRQRQWAKVFYGAVTNGSYMRMDALLGLAAGGISKEEMLGNRMGDFISEEYSKARMELGDTLDGYPYSLHYSSFNPFGLLRELTTDSALVLLGIKMILDPESIPLTSLAVLGQVSSILTGTVRRLFAGGGSLLEAFNGVKALYELEDLANEVKDGRESYPSEENSDQKGMEIEFKDVSFRYPRSDKVVLDNLSFKVPAGAICVIVGENGCGKSSTLKLLNRMYDVDSGEILVDGRSIKDYKVDDLRAASAFMHQTYQHYNFSIAENIGFGNVSRIGDLEAIQEAARLGGADEFIQKLPGGYGSRMSPEYGETMMSGDIPEGSALDVMIKARKDPPKDFSGGETQRLALSRTFMRSTTCDVKLVAYDEPSAALDPKAEFDLFERLRGLRDGKTMLFITHRFGYLTKYADMIIYMENGKVVEQGSHNELLALKGKYAHLYNIQAQAFSQDKLRMFEILY